MQFVLPVSQYLSRALDTARSTLTLLLSSRPLRRTHYTLLSFCLLFDHWSVSHALSLMQKLSAWQMVRTKPLRREPVTHALSRQKKISTEGAENTENKLAESRTPDTHNLSPTTCYLLPHFSRIKERNSSRVCTFSRNAPSMALVTVCEFCFSTPRITMHRCRASTTTPTPNGAIFCWMALAIWFVRRS